MATLNLCPGKAPGANISTYRKKNTLSKKPDAPLKKIRTISLRAISTARLRTLPPLHLQPIDVVISHGPLKKSHLVVGFALICIQRLSLPDIATRQCPWRDNRYTSGPSDSVLSY